MRLNNIIVEFMPNNDGKYGLEGKRELRPTCGMNVKGVMDYIEFE